MDWCGDMGLNDCLKDFNCQRKWLIILKTNTKYRKWNNSRVGYGKLDFLEKILMINLLRPDEQKYEMVLLSRLILKENFMTFP